MWWKPWPAACVSLLLLLACATASESPLKVSMTIGGGKISRTLELNGREYTVTLSTVGLDGKPSVRSRPGTLDKAEYKRLTDQVGALDLASYQPLYTGKDAHLVRAIINLRIDFKGAARSVTVVGSPPAEVEPLLAPFLPLVERVP